MALSDKAKKRFIAAMAKRKEAEEILAAIESGGNPVAANVTALGAISGTYAVPAEPTGAEVDATVQTVATKVNDILTSLKNAGLMASS